MCVWGGGMSCVCVGGGMSCVCVWGGGGVGAVCVCVCGGQLNLTTINELFRARKLTFSMHNCTYKLDNRRKITQSKSISPYTIIA